MLAMMRGTESLPITQSLTKSAPLSTLELKLIKLNQQISKTFLTSSQFIDWLCSIYQCEAWTLNKCQSEPIATESVVWSLARMLPDCFQPPVSPGACQHWHQPGQAGQHRPPGPVTLHTDTGGQQIRLANTQGMERKMSWIWHTGVDWSL